MKIIYLVALTFFPLPTFAEWSDTQLQNRHKVFSELNKERTRAEEMPPCEGLERLAEVAGRQAPPAFCKQSKVFFNSFQKMEKHFQKTCRDLYKFSDRVFRKKKYCDPAKALTNKRDAENEIKKMKDKLDPFIDAPEMTNVVEDTHMAEEDETRWTGEYAKAECALPIIIGMQLRKIELMMLNKHFGYVETALDSGCEKSSTDIEDLFHYQRLGLKGLTR